MIKRMVVTKFILVGLSLMALDGCTFIVKDDNAEKYYGIDERRGREYLNLVLDKQQQVYQEEKALRTDKNQ